MGADGAVVAQVWLTRSEFLSYGARQREVEP